eukprot:TRINITY_DN12670_c0_g2_i2.p1 TRINITY_DN12670_c0_g2~~TRINITY_DN12670_c0_g2_i2.p1  ORF type:complete len:340 (-),score=21.25 TRINITY_DN12670_c0_g2_i2:28-1047(-)
MVRVTNERTKRALLGSKKNSENAGTSFSSSASNEQAISLLSNELERHGLDSSQTSDVAQSIEQLVLGSISDPSRRSAEIRQVLRRLRSLRASGVLVASDSSAGCNAGIAQSIWTRLFSTGSNVATSQPAIPCDSRVDGKLYAVVPPMASDSKKLCFLLYGFLTVAECSELLEQANEQGWEQASLEYSGDRAGEGIVDFRLRDSDRCMLFNEHFASKIWQRLQSYIPSDTFEPLRPVAVNSCFRCLKYSKGQAGFSKHYDGQCVVAGAVSKVTVQLYLNDGFEGGATRLCVMDDGEDATRGIDVTPRVGMAFVFDQSILHSGRPVSSGTKYAARTEIMYR